MKRSSKIVAVANMQRLIHAHFDEEITLEDLSRAAGYSKYHAARLFKELTGKTPFETIRALRLTKAAQSLQAVSYTHLVKDGASRIIVRGENLEDLVRNDI